MWLRSTNSTVGPKKIRQGTSFFHTKIRQLSLIQKKCTKCSICIVIIVFSSPYIPKYIFRGFKEYFLFFILHWIVISEQRKLFRIQKDIFFQSHRFFHNQTLSQSSFLKNWVVSNIIIITKGAIYIHILRKCTLYIFSFLKKRFVQTLHFKMVYKLFKNLFAMCDCVCRYIFYIIYSIKLG